jgi:hypothetical protein
VLREKLEEGRDRVLALSTEIVVLKRAASDAKVGAVACNFAWLIQFLCVQRDRATLAIALAAEKERTAVSHCKLTSPHA